MKEHDYDQVEGKVVFAQFLLKTEIKTRGVEMTSASKDVSNVTALAASQQVMHFMPRFEKNLAQRLKGIFFYDCHMKAIERDDMRQFPNVESLTLGQNNLEWLDDDLFEFNPKLKLVNVAFNQISMIGAKTFEPLKNLKELWVGGNVCKVKSAYDMEKVQELKATILEKCVYDPEVVAEKKKKLAEA